MIKFPCRCSHLFTLDNDMAGGLIQCPQCGRLNDVPTLSDLPYLSDDGTYTLEPEAQKEEPNRLSDLHRMFVQARHDDEGQDIDLRPTTGDIEDRGEIPLKGDEDKHQAIP